jgi:SPP1 gp7 family putative phage head morphogenesis protein
VAVRLPKREGGEEAAKQEPADVAQAPAVQPLPSAPTAQPTPFDTPFQLPEDAGPEPVVTFPVIERAAADLATRNLLTRPQYDALDNDARRTAFTVARVASLDALEKLRDALVKDVQEGGTLKEFQGAVDDALGASALAPSHVESVYRTNIGQAHRQGQQEVLAHRLVSDEFPYVAYESTHDSRRRQTHAWFETHGLDGTNVYRADDPTVRKFWAPWDWQCRCIMIPLSLEDAAGRGVAEAQAWLETGRPPDRPAFVQPPPFEPPAGFAGVPM